MNEKLYLPPVLETGRLILRPLCIEDKEAIFKWAGDPRVSKFMMYTNYNSPDDADGWINALYHEKNELEYGFVLKETGELIGSGGMYFRDEETKSWDIGYNIRYDMWGRGLVPEAMSKIIEYARENCEVGRIAASFAKDNPKSGRVMEKLGMKYCKEKVYSKFDGSASFDAIVYERIF